MEEEGERDGGGGIERWRRDREMKEEGGRDGGGGREGGSE